MGPREASGVDGSEPRVAGGVKSHGRPLTTKRPTHTQIMKDNFIYIFVTLVAQVTFVMSRRA